MKFYIVTPTFNSLHWLRCCLRSVADQVCPGVEVHHHVQDGVSTDGTLEWLAEWQAAHSATPGYTFTYESVRDAGMYDALNKAWDKLPPDADVTAHLNSDEQYLPGGLSGIAAAFARDGRADLVLGAVYIVNADGSYHCHRRSMVPHLWSSYLGCVNSTCVCFHRASSFRRYGVRFDIRYRSIGDVVFYRDIFRLKPRVRLCNALFVSVFTLTGENLAWSGASDADMRIYRPTVPRWRQVLQPFFQRFVNLGRYIVDFFSVLPRAYEIYLGGEAARTRFTIDKPMYRWKSCKNTEESDSGNV